MELISTIGVSVLSGTIYDTVKFTIGKFIDRQEKRKDKKEILQKINDDIYRDITDDVKMILESATFVQYFNSSRFLDVINAYLEQKIITNYASNYTAVKKHIRSGEILTTPEIANYITDEIMNLYTENKVISIPSRDSVYGAIDQIIQICEKNIVASLSPENSRMLYMNFKTSYK